MLARAMAGPMMPKARRSTVLLSSAPVTGGRVRTSRAGGSAPSAAAARVSVPISMASTCSTPRASGIWPPDRAQTTKGASSATLSVRW